MKELVNKELIALQNELQNLGQAVQHISKAEAAATSMVEQTTQIQTRYVQYLQQTFDTFQNYATQNQEQVTEVRRLLQKYLELAEATTKISAELRESNLSGRMEKVETSVAAMEKQVGNMQVQMHQLQADNKTESASIRRLNMKLNTTLFLTIASVLLSVGIAVAVFSNQMH